MMDCRKLTNDVLIGPMSPTVRTHLEGCASCRTRREELRAIERDLAALGRALPSGANPALAQRIVARIPKQPTKASVWRWAIGFAAAAAAILLTVLLATRETPAPAPAPREMVAVPAPPPIETVLDPVPPPPPAPKTPEPIPVPIDPARPVPSPAPVPAPKPVEPEKTPPAPVEPPRPAPALPETKPLRTVFTLANVEGALELQDGTSWRKISKTAEWDEASALRASDKPARFTLPDGTRATLRPCRKRDQRAKRGRAGPSAARRRRPRERLEARARSPRGRPLPLRFRGWTAAAALVHGAGGQPDYRAAARAQPILPSGRAGHRR